MERERRYRDDTISISHQLEELDGKIVTRNEKMYLGQIRQRRTSRGRGQSRGPSAPPQRSGNSPSSDGGSPGQGRGMMQEGLAAMRSASQPPRQRSSPAAKR